MGLRDELMAERERLEAEIRKLVGPLQHRLKLIEELLDSLEPAPAARVAPPSGANGQPSRFEGKGLRESILMMLGDMGSGKPAQVTRMLERHGYPDEGDAKTPLGTRVGNEMWRMEAKEKTLTKNKRGEYAIAEKGEARKEEPSLAS